MWLQFFKCIDATDLLVFIILLPIGVIGFDQLHSVAPSVVRSGQLALFTLVVFQLVSFSQRITAVRFRRLKDVEAFVEGHLYSRSRWQQNRAARVLGVLVGDRFGRSLIGRRGKIAVESWQK